MTDVAQTLTQRNSTHGNFEDNGEIMQNLKRVMREFRRSSTPNSFFHPFEQLTPYQREALDMIMHKVGRILSGDPNFADHWHDIAGYAKLCEDRCQPSAGISVEGPNYKGTARHMADGAGSPDGKVPSGPRGA